MCVKICCLTAFGLAGATIEWEIKKVCGEVISGQMLDRWQTMFLDSHTIMMFVLVGLVSPCTPWTLLVGAGTKLRVEIDSAAQT